MISVLAKTPLQAGILVLIGQLIKEKRLLRGVLDPGRLAASDDAGAGVVAPVSTVGGRAFNESATNADRTLSKFDSDEEECFQDADKEDTQAKKEKGVLSGWQHARVSASGKSGKGYDAWARNP